jgi:streptogramin lyase
MSPGSGCFGCGQASLGGIAAGADGNIWFTNGGQYKVGRITPSGVITQFDLPAIVGGPSSITSGPDGNIWITTNALGQGRQDWIVRLGRDGAVTQFPAGAGSGNFSTGPQGITPGPDGNLWFTEFWANRIGRMTPAGVLTEFPIPTPETAPRGIVAGPDGNLWFLETHFRHTAVARITTAGVVTEYSLGGGADDQLQPTDIVAGFDGNLWLNQTHPSAPQGEIVRVTRDGALKVFAMPKGTRPGGMASGPDGNIWFTDSSGNMVGRMSPSGVLRQFLLPRRLAQPVAIVAGPGGRMWFTESSRIASIGMTVPEAKLSSRVLTFAGPTTRSVTITNDGEAPLRVSSVAIVGSDRAEFAVIHDVCSNHPIAGSGGTCRVDVAFKPGVDAGVLAARLTIADNASATPQSVSLVAQLPDCRLPLFAFAGSTSISHGEFLSVRDGAVVEDPNGTFSTDSSHSQSQSEPILHGNLPATYVRAAARWVPASAISPDGSRYSYVDYLQPGVPRVHVTDVATGRDRVLALPAGYWAVVAFTADGIYLDQRYEGIGPGLTLVNPDSGAIQTVFSDAAVALISGRVAWIDIRDNTDPLPGPGGIGPASNEIQRRDLTTLQTTTWLYRSGFGLYAVAATGDSIIVSGDDTSARYLWVMSAPGQAVPITVPETADAVPLSQGLIADANGWWLGSLDGIYLWTPHTGAVLVSESLAAPAGACA